MRIRGVTFVGTATAERPAMAAFARDVLGLDPIHVEGVDADLFGLPDGTSFAVADPRSMGVTSRTIGFLVDDIEEAIAELRAAGCDLDDEVATNERHRYVHFRAPDGHLYELVEERGD
ncbi:MAG: glyoxylase family protein [Gaiellaceae bacterium]|jgi:glyoxylase I family protein|nr:glyoxylase family protein [Gaiellaceae bacterium]